MFFFRYTFLFAWIDTAKCKPNVNTIAFDITFLCVLMHLKLS